MAFGKSNADILAEQFDVERGLGSATLSYSLKGSDLVEDVVCLDRAVLQLGTAGRAEREDVAGAIEPLAQDSGYEIEPLEATNCSGQCQNYGSTGVPLVVPSRLYGSGV